MALDKMVFKEDEVERLQTKIKLVSQDTNRLYLQLRGQTNNWGGIPLGSDLIRAQTLINELTVEAEKLEDIIRLAVKGVQGAQDENKRQANQLFQQLGTLGGMFGKLGGGSASGQFPIPTYAQKIVTKLITSVAALMGRDELNSDPLVQKLQTTVKNSGLGTIDSIAAHSKLKDIYQARDQIAKAQTAYKVYQAFGNKTQMDAMHKLAEDARQKLKYLGIDEVHYKAGKDLSGYFKKPVVKACDYDPSITTSSVPLVQNESYMLMLRMAMEPGDQGAWAKRQLVGERLNIPPMKLPDGTPITAYNNKNEITLNYFNAHVLKPNETNSLSAYYSWLESTYGMTEWRKKVVQADAVTRAFVGSLIEETVMGVVDTVTFTFHFVIDPEKTTQEMADTASYIMQHPEVLAEAAKKMYHNFNEGTPEEKASMLGAAASVLVPGLSVTKGTKVGKVADGVQDFATKAMEGVKDLNKVLQNSGHLAELPRFKPFLSTPEGVPLSVGKIPMDSNSLPKTFVQEHYINEMNGFGDVKGGKIEGTGKANKANLKNIDDFINGNKNFNEVIEDYAKIYKEQVDSNKPWSWDDTIPGGDSLSAAQKRKIKEMAVANRHIPEIKVTKVDGMRYGFADFAGAGVVKETVQLPEKSWKLSDKEQFKWLDEQIGGTRKGMTWHHTEIPGKMELVPFGIHNITPHNGGRTAGMWADAPR
ncbi:HNH endonuclease signature motif containing protein [Paenibacillus sp. FSL K6-2859]|uniref:HNH endonuclease signature motif containing protein n=1 Tax=Paenibacillus sp. FSL K6-2859 TaxID=2921482 RepID=UPI0030FBCCE0